MPEKQKFVLQLRVSIRPEEQTSMYSGTGLEINESMAISTEGFLGVCSILSKFHELAETLKAENSSSITPISWATLAAKEALKGK